MSMSDLQMQSEYWNILKNLAHLRRCLFDEQVNFGKSKLPAKIVIELMICVSYSRYGLDLRTTLLFTGGFNITFTASDDIVSRCIRK